MFGRFQYIVLWALALLALGMAGFALIDALTQKRAAFVAAGKLTKPIWLGINAVATSLAFLSLPTGFLNTLGFLSMIAVVAAGVYLADVRPALRRVTGGGGSQQYGPYGPW